MIQATILSLLLLGFTAGASTLPVQGPGFKLVVLYDAKAESQAKEFVEGMLQLEPFAHLKGWFSVTPHLMAEDTLVCGNDRGTRLLACLHPEELYKLGKTLGATRTLVITSMGRGGGGGVVAVSGPGRNYPVLQTTLHEFLHQLDFVDEYAYDGSYGIYACESIQEGAQFPNVIYHDFTGTSFSSESEARAFLADKIPWISKIPASVKILENGRLGTPREAYPLGTIGLFRSGSCNLFLPGWAAQENSIMLEVNRTVAKTWTPYYAGIVEAALIEAVKNSQPEEPPVTEPNPSSQPKLEPEKDQLYEYTQRMKAKFKNSLSVLPKIW